MSCGRNKKLKKYYGKVEKIESNNFQETSTKEISGLEDFKNRRLYSNKILGQLSIQNFFSKINHTVFKLHDSMLDIRMNMERFILEALENLKSKESVIVFGAGPCNDIPLELLTENFSQVILVDIDIISTQKAIERLDISLRSKVKIIQMDISGLDELFAKIKRLSSINASVNEIELLLNTYEYKSIELLPEINTKYDLSISSCVATQLVTPYITHILRDNYINDNIYKIITSIARKAAYNHCYLVRKHTKDAGFSIITTDVFEWGYFANNPISLANALPSLPITMNFQEFINIYLNKYRDYMLVGSTILYDINTFFNNVVARGWYWEIENSTLTYRLYMVMGALLKPKPR
ncbi:MAG: hypothetical protein A4E53_00327 [Pelotomaculum sp. PtaB.Bin104]|nr:MAG: hypothetical protein A4E53_00327 [Pelotomaculum sp. PtaB.Bin104]